MLDETFKHLLLERVKQFPILDQFQMELLSLEEGYCEAKIPRKLEYDGLFHSFHGGLLATIADSIAGMAVLTKANIDTKLATTDMHIRFLSPCLTDVITKANVIKHGRTLSPVQVEQYDTKGVHVTTSQITYITF